MICDHIKLGNGETDAVLHTYLSQESYDKYSGLDKRYAIIVMPGGAYAGHAWHEGEPIVKKFMAAGFNGFILQYSVKAKAVFPRPLLDASLAVAYVRTHAEEFHIDPDHIFVLGFSAGGHLAASIGTLWNKDVSKYAPDMPYGINKPNGMILGYPAITIYDHHLEDFFHRIWGADECPEEFDILKNVDEDSAQAYIWTTRDDECVPSQCSLLLANALLDKNVRVRMHIYEHGRHGLGLANEEACGQLYKDISGWIDEAIYWAYHMRPNFKKN